MIRVNLRHSKHNNPCLNNQTKEYRDFLTKALQETAYYKTIDHRPATDHRPIGRSSTDPPTTNSPTGPPPTHRPPIHRQLLHRPTDHQLTDLPTLLQLITNPLTHRTYFSRVTIGTFISLINFSLSFRLDTIYYWISKIILKMIGKKERW